MSKTPAINTALMSALALPPAGDEGDHWVHLLPAATDGLIKTADERGPYRVASQVRIMDQSLALADKLPIDENHSIDKAGPKGAPSPAVGWIVEMQSRKDGIWGRVEWNDRGRDLIAQKAYRAISPVIGHTKDKTIGAILRASLVNTPNLSGMIALHSEEPDMGMMEKLRKKLGLADDADEGAVMAALDKLKDGDKKTVATQSQLDVLAEHLNVDAGSSIEDLTTAAQSIAEDGDKDELIAALQTSVKELGSEVTSLVDGGKRSAAEGYIDAALAQGRAGLNATVRDQYVSMHMKDPEATQSLIEAMPVLSGALPRPDLTNSSIEGLDGYQIAEQAVKYQKERAEAGFIISIADAVTHIEERKA